MLRQQRIYNRIPFVTTYKAFYFNAFLCIDKFSNNSYVWIDYF